LLLPAALYAQSGELWLSAGASLLANTALGSASASGSSNDVHLNGSWRPGFNYGGGLQFRLSPLFAWRFDVRGYDTGKPDWAGILYKQGGLLHQTEASVGFGYVF
jgi:opacity protein-like surface antigen